MIVHLISLFFSELIGLVAANPLGTDAMTDTSVVICIWVIVVCALVAIGYRVCGRN